MNAKQAVAIAALTRGESQENAASEAGVSTRTLRRWLDRPDFRAGLKATQEEAFGATVAALARLGPRAVAVLEACMEPGSEPRLRLRAASEALRLAVTARDEDTDRRLSALEAALGILS